MSLLDRTAHDPTDQPVAEPPHRHHRVLARLRARRLDAQLARGCSPDDGGQRAARATQLLASRHRLAGHWEDVLERAALPHSPTDPRLPLPRRRVLSLAPEIQELAARLRVDAPLPVRGVAMAHCLLTDGCGPLYGRSGRAALEDALGATARYLDPAIALDAGHASATTRS